MIIDNFSNKLVDDLRVTMKKAAAWLSLLQAFLSMRLRS